MGIGERSGVGRVLGVRRPVLRERLLEDLVDPSGSCRLSPEQGGDVTGSEL